MVGTPPCFTQVSGKQENYGRGATVDGGDPEVAEGLVVGLPVEAPAGVPVVEAVGRAGGSVLPVAGPAEAGGGAGDGGAESC